MSDLPVNIDSTYEDTDPSVVLHQQHHDALHGLLNDISGATPDLAARGIAAAGHNHDSAYAQLDGEYAVNTVATSGATETLTLAPAHKVTMDQNCTFTFPSPSAGHTFSLLLTGAFTPTFPASVDWDSATAPTYASPSKYVFETVDGGTTWVGTLVASAVG